MFSKDVYFIVISINVMYLLKLCVCTTGLNSDFMHRSKRQLLFPNSTLLQFNVGVSVPSPVDHIVVNWAFQANFQLPWNRTQIPIDILEANSGFNGDSRKKRNVKNEVTAEKHENKGYNDETQLVHFYKYVEDVLNSFGHNGTSCVLRALCQIGAEPLHSFDDEDLYHEIASFLLNPRNEAKGKISKHDEIYPYLEAHKLGARHNNCTHIYSDCTLSLADMFSQVESVL